MAPVLPCRLSDRIPFELIKGVFVALRGTIATESQLGRSLRLISWARTRRRFWGSCDIVTTPKILDDWSPGSEYW
jgi:hypothetical protein